MGPYTQSTYYILVGKYGIYLRLQEQYCTSEAAAKQAWLYFCNKKIKSISLSYCVMLFLLYGVFY